MLLLLLNPFSQGEDDYDMISRCFDVADLNHDGYLSVDEFYLFYYSELKAK